MPINIEDISMEEYEILIRGGNSPGLGRLSIKEMTMEEYDEMIRRRNGSKLDRLLFPIGDRQGPPEFYADEEEFTDEDEDREWEELEMWLTDKIDKDSMYIPFPEKKVHSKEIINETSSPTTSLPESSLNHFHESGKFVNLISCDFTNEFVEFEQEIIDQAWFDALLLNDEKVIGSKTNQVVQIIYSLEAFDSTKDLKELEDLVDDSEMSLFDETCGHAREIIEPSYSIIALEKNFKHKLLFATLQDVCVTHFNPRREDVLLCETSEWKDAWVELCKVLIQSNEALFLDDCLKNC